MQLTLRQIFGISATQTANELIIQKADLAGLTPLNNNSAKQLLAAILLKSLSNFEGVLKNEFGNAILDERAATIEYDNSNLYETLRLFQWKTQLIKTLTTSYVKHTIVFERRVKYEI